MINLIVMRHGHAESTHTNGDAARQLTEHGIQSVEQVVTQLAKQAAAQDFSLVKIFHSPYVRTRQTAERAQSILAQQANCEIQAVWDALTPNSQPDSLFQHCQQFADLPAKTHKNTLYLLVTHQPLISHFIASLATGNVFKANQYPMSPSDAAWLTGDFLDKGTMQLKTILSV